MNNSGVGAVGGVAGHDIDLWRATLETNLTGPFLLMRAILPHMIKNDGGSLVHISSVAGVRSSPEAAAYCTSKAGLIMLGQQVALDFGKYGIRSNIVCPGWVRTPMSEQEMDELGGMIGKNREEAFDEAVKDLPLSRVAAPDEIANVCLFLASNDSSFMTGAALMVDGGFGCRRRGNAALQIKSLTSDEERAKKGPAKLPVNPHWFDPCGLFELSEKRLLLTFIPISHVLVF